VIKKLSHAITSSKSMQAVTLHTNHGDLKLELYCEEAPKTSENFLALCASSYYDDTTFHRHIPGFMIQGGDPTGTGQGGRSIYNTPSGKFADEIVQGLSHNKAGVVSMANSGPNTNGVRLSPVLDIFPCLLGILRQQGDPWATLICVDVPIVASADDLDVLSFRTTSIVVLLTLGNPALTIRFKDNMTSKNLER
jgi:peptidyl-prolyl cis-trans isomerase-like 3